MKFIVLLVLNVSIYNLTICQEYYLPIKHQSVDNIKYKEYKSRLYTALKEDSEEPNWSDKHNIWVYYVHLRAPKDTIRKYFFEAVKFDSIYECDWFLYNAVLPYRKLLEDNNRGMLYDSFERKCNQVMKNLDSSLIRQLDTISTNDQLYRTKLQKWGTEMFNRKNLEVNTLWVKQDHIDSLNFIAVQKILDQQGYPGKSKIGIQHMSVITEVLLHSNEKMIEANIHHVQKAIDENQTNSENIAYLIDRLALMQNRPQTYGTQVVPNEEGNGLMLYKIKSIEEARKLRKKLKMEKLELYLQQFNIKL